MHPACFLAARASRVRWEIRFLSISAARANAKAMILELMLSERLKLSLMVRMNTPFCEQAFSTDITMSMLRPRREISVHTSRSVFFILRSRRPSLRFSQPTVPETVSVTQKSMRTPWRRLHCSISNLWFSSVCACVLTLMYAYVAI